MILMFQLLGRTAQAKENMLHNLVFVSVRTVLLLCLLFHSAIASPNPLQAKSPLCDKDLFGTPKIDDCYQAMIWIPYMNPPARLSKDAMASRIFAEPQYLIPPFTDVKNAYAPKAIVQLPKIWKYGMSFQNYFFLSLAVFAPGSSSSEHDRILVGSCHIALIPQPYKKTSYSPPEVKAEFRAKWTNIVDAVLRLRTCLQPKRGPPQGGYTPLTSESFANPKLKQWS